VTKLLGESVATFTPIKQEAFLAAVTDVSDLLTRDLTTASPDDKIGVDGEARRLLLQQRILQGTQSSPAVLALYTVFQATEKELQEGVSNLDLAHTSGSLLDAYRLELAARGVPPEDDLTTSTINETNPVDPDGGGTSSTGAIIGGVVAGVAAAGLLAFAAFRKCGSKPLMPCCSAPDEEEDGYYNGISGVKTGPYSVKPEEASAPHLSRNSFSLASAPIGPRFSNDLSAAAEVQQMTESGYGSTARILLDYVGSDGLASSWHATRAAIAEPSPLVDPAHLLLGGIICQFQGYDLSLTAKNFPEIRKWCLSYQAILVTLDQKVKELSTVDEEGDLVSALELAPSQSDLEGGQSTGSVSSVAVADGDASAVKSTGGHSAAVSVTRGTTSSDAGALIDDGSGNMALSADQESGRLVEVEDSLYFILRNCGSHTRRRMLPQFAVSRRCQCLLDDASASLRVCLLRMDMGADEELLSMLSAMESIELNIDDNVTVLLGAMKINSEEQDMEVQLAELGRALRQMGDGATDQGQEPPAGDNATLDTVLFCSDGRSMPEAEPANHMSKNLPDYEDIEATLARLQVSPDSIQRVRPHPLGKGAFSEVYLVRHEGELRAAKCVEISDFNARQLQQVYLRFAKEIYVLSKLSHNHIISIRGAVATTDQLCILLDYMSRGSVRQMLDDDHTGGEFSQKYGTNIVLQMAQGLQYLHSQGVLHRDLKSANVLVDEDWSIRIADFGMSRTSSIVSSYAGSTASVASFRGGTLAWSPPELFGHPPKHGSKSDVWSFGVVAWEILCGGTSPPWSWLELPAMMVTLSEGQALPVPSSLHLREEHRALMNACWTRDPQLRPNFDQIVETLEAMRPSSTADDDLVLIPRRE
jgi:tRNA A-37 threonylcarbamoyl transferase component Bud32